MTWYTMGTDGNIYEMILPYPSLSCFLVAAHVFKFHKSFDVLLITTKRSFSNTLSYIYNGCMFIRNGICK